MKLINSFVIVASLLAVISCKDTKEEEAVATAATIEKIEETELE